MFLFPESGQNRMKLSKKEYFLGILGVVLIFLFIILFAFETRHFSNTFEVKNLVKRSLAIGFLTACVISFFYTKRYSESLDKLQITIFFIVSCLLSFPLLGSLSNRLLSFSPKEKVEVEYNSQEVYSKSRFGKVKSKPDGLFLFFVKDQKIERVKTEENIFPKAKKGDRVYIVIKKGFWGYEYFLEE